MSKKIERLIKSVYRKWKNKYVQSQDYHPSDEDMACFIEHKLSARECMRMKEHILICPRCAETVSTVLKLKTKPLKKMPPALHAPILKKEVREDETSVLEIHVRLDEDDLEVLDTTGNVLLGRKFVRFPVLRKRQIMSFSDEINILADFRNINIEVIIENQQGRSFGMAIIAKEKNRHKAMSDLWVSLIQDELEIESLIFDSGRVFFKRLLLGKYTLEVSKEDNRLVSILLNVEG